MSVEVMTLVWKSAPFQGNTLLTLLALADWSNDEGISWPSVATLAKKSRQSERNCRYSLRSLETADYVAVIPGDKKSETYQINLVKLAGGQTLPGAKKSNRGGKREQKIVQSLPPEVSLFAPYTSIDTSVDTPEILTPSAEETIPSWMAKMKLDPKKFKEAIDWVFSYYLSKFGLDPKLYTFTEKRREKCRMRLRESLEMCAGNIRDAVFMMKMCIDKLGADKFYMERGMRDFDKHLFHSREMMENWLSKGGAVAKPIQERLSPAEKMQRQRDLEEKQA